MHVDLTDFQKKLLVRSLESFIAGIPTLTEDRVLAHPVDQMNDLVRSEATELLATLNGVGDLRPRNTFKNAA